MKDFTIEEAFRQLNNADKLVIDEAAEKLGYKCFEDLFDQVYYSLAHGGDGSGTTILGDLSKSKYKYNDRHHIFVDYNKPGVVRIGVIATPEGMGNAIAVAEIYGLDYDIKPYSATQKQVLISVPEDMPVNRSVFGYKDTEGKLKDIRHTESDSAIRRALGKAELEKERKLAAERDEEEREFMKYFRSEEDDEAEADAFAAAHSKKRIPINASLTEDVESSMPATPLSASAIHDFVDNLPEATPTRPPQAFKLGYIRELKVEIPAKYKGGRGSEGEPFVRIFKATEYSRLYTKAPYENLNSTKAFRKETGKEAGHERTGFHSNNVEAGNILNAIGSYPNGELALQAYPMSDNKIKVAYFISIDGDDLVPATKNDVAKYLTPTYASRILGTSDNNISRSADNINRFKLSGIYMIGNLGHSII